jgi:hypothetical protein
VQLDASGRALAVWAQVEGGKSVIQSRIHNGQGWGLIDVVSASNASEASQPSLAATPSGEAVVVWLQSQGPSTNALVRANRFAPSTGWQGAQVIGNASGTDQPQWPQIALSANGQAVAVWEQTAPLIGSPRTDVWSNQLNGSQWGSAELLEVENQGNALRPVLAIDAQGQALAAWQQATNITVSGVFQIKSRRFTPAGGWEAVQRVDTFAGSASQPSIAMDAQGNALLAWTQPEQNSGVTQVLSAQRAKGQAWQTPERISAATTPLADAVQVSVNAMGQAVAAWQQDDSAQPTDERVSAYASRFTPAQGWSVAELIEANEFGSAFQPKLGIDAQGNALAIWKQGSGPLSDPNVRIDVWANVLR